MTIVKHLACLAIGMGFCLPSRAQNVCAQSLLVEVSSGSLSKSSNNGLSSEKRVYPDYKFTKDRKSPLSPKPIFVRLFENVYRWYFKPDNRLIRKEAFNYLDDRHYIKMKRTLDRMGIVRSEFNREFDTRVFFTATGVPDANGKIPYVDPNAKALFIYFHGSGTSKASGANFAGKMNRLAQMGFSAVSFDLPFHADGSRNVKMAQADVFYSRVKRFVDQYRAQGVPVYLAGHSFGPDIVAEFATRYPFAVDGVLMISPGGYNKDLEQWFMNRTAWMTALWGDMVTNDDGAAWAGLISASHKWRQPKNAANPDPTLVNPRLKINVVSGQYEEYIPGPLDERGLPLKVDRHYDVPGSIKQLLHGAKVTIEPGVGHYIFEHKDKDGLDVVLREHLAIAGYDLRNEKDLKATSVYNLLPDHQEIARRYSRDEFFKAFVDRNHGGWETVKAVLENQNLALARKLQNDFGKHVSVQRERGLASNIKSTAEWAPAFYTNNKTEIDALDLKKPRPSDALVNKYFNLLEMLNLQSEKDYGLVSDEIFNIPERPARPEPIGERRTENLPKAS